MPYSSTLAYLRNAVQETLGDIDELIPAGFIDRAINEGQRRMQPDLLLEKSAVASIAIGAETFQLPSDLVRISRFRPDNGVAPLAEFHKHGTVIYFVAPLVRAFTGTLLYGASFPDITSDVNTQVPPAAADGLVSFALYKSYRRLASNRAEYRKFATIVGNGVSMGDLEATAEAHLADWRDALASVVELEAPVSAYGA